MLHKIISYNNLGNDHFNIEQGSCYLEFMIFFITSKKLMLLVKTFASGVSDNVDQFSSLYEFKTTCDKIKKENLS